MTIESYIQVMPKVELHVHMEGSTRPETLLKLAQRSQVELPASNLEELRKWYDFVDFDHFLEIYIKIGECLRTVDDIELIAREFLASQAEQRIIHSEVTYTPYIQHKFNGISFDDQMTAINRAMAWAERELGVTMSLTIDIPRGVSSEEGIMLAEWAISGMDRGVTAFGLGGPEVGNPPERYREAFDKARAAGLHSAPHAGEMAGPESIWGALRALHADRIGHGVRCLEDPDLVEELRARQVPLEVCPTSNVCLKVVPDIESHPLPQLLDEGLYVTLNTDDPPMFNTTLVDEYISAARILRLGVDTLEELSLNALRASFLDEDTRKKMEESFSADFRQLRKEHLDE